MRAFFVWADEAWVWDVIGDPIGDGEGGVDDFSGDGVDFVEGFVAMEVGVDGDKPVEVLGEEFGEDIGGDGFAVVEAGVLAHVA